MTPTTQQLSRIALATCMALAGSYAIAQSPTPPKLTDPNSANRPATNASAPGMAASANGMQNNRQGATGNNVTGTTGSPAMGSTGATTNTNNRDATTGQTGMNTSDMRDNQRAPRQDRN